jgi:predicted porin
VRKIKKFYRLTGIPEADLVLKKGTVMKQPVFQATALSIALATFAPLPVFAATKSNVDLTKQLEALSRRVQELERKLAEKSAVTPAVADQETDQRIRVLDRKLEIANEDAAATKAAAVKEKTAADKKAKLLPTVYGKISIAQEDRNLEGAENFVGGKVPGAVNHRRGLESYASRIGVKGEAELNSDLKVIYQAEYEINVDNGDINVDNGDKGGSSSSTTSVNGDDWAFSQRNTFAGLKSNTWGQIIAGKIDTPFKSAEGRFDQFNDQRADIDNLIGGQNRVPNIIIYSTPKLLDAVTLNVAFIENEGQTTTANNGDINYDGHRDHSFADAYSASIVAEQGIFYGALAYDKNVVGRRSVDNTIVNPTTITSFASNSVEAYRFVGGIKSDIWEGGVLLQRSRDEAGIAPVNSHRYDSAYLLSGAVNVLEKVKLKAQYGVSDGHVSDETGKLYAVGADYNFTPKTKVYTYYSTLNFDKADVTDKTLALGLDHSF